MIPWAGGTAASQVATLAVYMGGLFLGARLGIARADRARDKRRTFLIVEAAAVAAAFLSINALPLADPLFALAAAGPLLSGFVGGAARGLTGGLLILPSTFLMGFAFPFAVQLLNPDGRSRAGAGLVYGLNSFGAGVGALAGGLILLPAVGVLGSSASVLLVDLSVLGIAAVWKPVLVNAIDRQPEAPAAVAGPVSGSPAQTWLLVAVAAGGAVALAMEVVLFRALGMILGPTARAFTVVLAAYVIGLGLGSLASLRAVNRSPPRAPWIFIGCWLVTGVAVLVIGHTLDLLPAMVIAKVATPGSEISGQLGYKALFAAVAILPVTLAFGVSYAAAAAIGSEDARWGGRVYAALTLGNVLGLTAAAFALALGIDIEVIIAILAALAFATPLPVLLNRELQSRLPRTLALGSAALALSALWLRPAWDWKALNSAPYLYSRADREKQPNRYPIFRESGFETTVAVMKRRGRVFFTLDGKADGSNTRTDMNTQSLLGILGAALHPSPGRTLLVGLGTGQSAANLLRFPVESLDVAEISPAVARVLPFFADINEEVWSDPRFQLLQTDGRTVLRYAADRYDLIVSEPSNVWVPGVAHLFTVEAFAEARDRLTPPHGIYVQWLHAYRLDPEAFRTVIRSFLTVFPHATLWTSAIDNADVFLVGSLRPIAVDFESLQQTLASARVWNHTGPGGQLDAIGLLRHFVAGPDVLLGFAGPGDVSEDAKPTLEYSAEASLLNRDITAFHETAGELLETPETLLNDAPQAVLRTLRDRTDANRSFRALVGGEVEQSVDTEMRAVIDLVEKYPDDRELAWNGAQRIQERAGFAYRRGDLAAARSLLTRALKIWPEHEESLRMLVSVHRKAGEYERAATVLQDYKKAASGVEPLLTEGDLLLAWKRFPEAAEVFGQAVALDPHSVHARSNLGSALAFMGRFEGAAAAWKNALAVDPDALMPRRNLEKLRRQQK